MFHELGNVDRCRDDAQAVADDLTGEEKSIHGRHPPRRRILVGLSSGRPLRPDRWRASLANDGRQRAGSAVKTRDETANRQSSPIFFARGRSALAPACGPARGNPPAPGPDTITLAKPGPGAARAPHRARRWHGSPQRKGTPGDNRRPCTLVKMASQHACRSRGGGPAVGSDTKAHNQRCQPLSHSDLNRTRIRPLAQSYC